MGFAQGVSGINAAASNLDVIGNNIANSGTFGAKGARAEFSDVYAAALNGAGAAPSPPAPRPSARETVREAAGRWAVQVGAFRDETIARDWLTEVNRRFRSQFTAAERTVQNAEGWYRSRFTGMSEQAAQAACATLAERRVTCMVVRPQ